MLDYTQQSSHDHNVFMDHNNQSKYISLQSQGQARVPSRRPYARHSSMNQTDGYVHVIDENIVRASPSNQRLSVSPNHPHSAIERFHTPNRVVYQRGSNQPFHLMQNILEGPSRGHNDYQSRDYDGNMTNNYRSTRNSYINTNNQSFNELPRSNMQQLVY